MYVIVHLNQSDCRIQWNLSAADIMVTPSPLKLVLIKDRSFVHSGVVRDHMHQYPDYRVIPHTYN